MKTVTYPLRLPQALYDRVQAEAERRHKKLSEIFRELVTYGFESLPPLPEEATKTISDTWEKLGPAPEIDYDKL